MASDKQKTKAEPARAEPSGALDLGKIPLEVPEDGVFEAYSNVVNVNWTLYDIRIRFSELIQVADDERPTWENQHGILLERVAVTMSWHQAKHLRDLLGGIIENYEKLNGELKPIKLANRPDV
jgi:hypothetical protein